MGTVRIRPKRRVVYRGDTFLTSAPKIGVRMFFEGGLSTNLFNKRNFVVRGFDNRNLLFVRVSNSPVRCGLLTNRRLILSANRIIVVDNAYSLSIRAIGNIGGVLFNNRNLFGAIMANPNGIIIRAVPVSGLTGTVVPCVPATSGGSWFKVWWGPIRG